MKKSLSLVVAGVGSMVSASAFAAPVDLAPLTASVDFASVSTAVLAIGVAFMGVHIVMRGAKWIISMVKSG